MRRLVGIGCICGALLAVTPAWGQISTAPAATQEDKADQITALTKEFGFSADLATRQNVVNTLARLAQAAQGGEHATDPKVAAAAQEALARLITGVNDGKDRAAIFGGLATQTGDLARAALQAGNVDSAEKFLAVGYESGNESAAKSYAAFLLIEHLAQDRVKAIGAAEHKSPAVYGLQVDLYRGTGDVAGARTAAAASKDDQLIEEALLAAQDWKGLAASYRAKDGLDNDIGALGQMGGYCLVAGDTDGVQSVVEKILNFSHKNPNAGFEVGRALLMFGRTQEAASVLRTNGHLLQEAELSLAEGRSNQARDLLLYAAGSTPESQSYLQLVRMRIARQSGDAATSDRLLRDLENTAATSGLMEDRVALIKATAYLNSRPKLRAACAEALAAAAPADDTMPVLESLYGESAPRAQRWFAFLQDQDHTAGPGDLLERVDGVLYGTLDPKLFDVLIQKATASAVTLPAEQRSAWFEMIAAAIVQAGPPEAALERLTRLAVATHDPAITLAQADLLFRQGEQDKAHVLYEKLWQADNHNLLALYMAGRTLVDASQVQERDRLLQLAALLPLGDLAQRLELASALDTRKLGDDAEAQCKLIATLGWSWSPEVIAARQYLLHAAVSRGDYQAAADLAQLIFLGEFHSEAVSNDPGQWLQVPYGLYKYRALAGVQAGRVEEALTQLDTCWKLVPGDIDACVDVVPVLEAAGKKEAADGAFNSAYEALQKFIEDYPDSADLHNSIAWLAAKCRRNLEDARQHAMQAVALEPENAGYIDTLAEVNLAAGNAAAAVRMETQALKLDPTDPQLLAQFARFQKAAASTQP